MYVWYTRTADRQCSRRTRVGSSRSALRAGTAAIEFALTAPLLILLALAAADFGRIVHYYQVVGNAARTGAETGATHKFTDFTRPSWEAGIEQAVLDEMQNMPGFDQGGLTYELTTAFDSDNLARIAVDVTYPFHTVIAWPALPSEVMLHTRVEFRQFR